MQRYRTPESVKKRLDIMIRNNGEVVLDHGISSYEFDHYDYEAPSFDNGFQSKLHIYCKDWDKNNSVVHYMTVTENNLSKPTEEDWGTEKVCCYWEKEYPTLLYMKEYDVR